MISSNSRKKNNVLKKKKIHAKDLYEKNLIGRINHFVILFRIHDSVINFGFGFFFYKKTQNEN